MISAKTRLCAIIGDPVAHSLSPAMHNAAFASLGLHYASELGRRQDRTAEYGTN